MWVFLRWSYSHHLRGTMWIRRWLGNRSMRKFTWRASQESLVSTPTNSKYQWLRSPFKVLCLVNWVVNLEHWPDISRGYLRRKDTAPWRAAELRHWSQGSDTFWIRISAVYSRGVYFSSSTSVDGPLNKTLCVKVKVWSIRELKADHNVWT